MAVIYTAARVLSAPKPYLFTQGGRRFHLGSGGTMGTQFTLRSTRDAALMGRGYPELARKQMWQRSTPHSIL